MLLGYSVAGKGYWSSLLQGVNSKVITSQSRKQSGLLEEIQYKEALLENTMGIMTEGTKSLISRMRSQLKRKPSKNAQGEKLKAAITKIKTKKQQAAKKEPPTKAIKKQATQAIVVVAAKTKKTAVESNTSSEEEEHDYGLEGVGM